MSVCVCVSLEFSILCSKVGSGCKGDGGVGVKTARCHFTPIGLAEFRGRIILRAGEMGPLVQGWREGPGKRAACHHPAKLRVHLPCCPALHL